MLRSHRSLDMRTPEAYPPLLSRKPSPSGGRDRPGQDPGVCRGSDATAYRRLPFGWDQAAQAVSSPTTCGAGSTLVLVSERRRHADAKATALIARCTPRNSRLCPAPSRIPATSGPMAETPVCKAANRPSVVPTMPSGARDAVSGLSTGAYIVSPTANTPNALTNTAAASSGKLDAAVSMTQASVQMAPTTISRPGA